MTHDPTVFIDAVKSHFYSEVLILVLLVLLCIVAVIGGFFCFKPFSDTSKRKTLLIVLMVCLGSAVLLTIRTVGFLPVYTDYKNMSYIIEEDAEFYIIEGTNNPWDAKNEVLVTTGDGKKLNLPSRMIISLRRRLH